MSAAHNPELFGQLVGEPGEGYKPLRRVLSGVALKHLLSGKTGAAKHSEAEDRETVKYWNDVFTRSENEVAVKIVKELSFSLFKSLRTATTLDAYLSTSLSTFDNALIALGVRDTYSSALNKLGFRLEDLIDEERDAGLGNGGLGRLAACFVDSLACCNYPGWGYGLRYRYGMFQQQIHNGYQYEAPDCWLDHPNPWEFPRGDVTYKVKFYGNIAKKSDGTNGYKWVNATEYDAMAFDVPVPAFGTQNLGNIRLWSCKTNNLFDLNRFNSGDYTGASAGITAADTLTAVLYPNDNTNEGKELRLKQEYLFVSATIQDLVHRFKLTGKAWKDFPDLVAVQLNDTHPTIGITELQRILIDEEDLSWDDSWDIVTRTFAFTNHTILPEALEKWPVPVMTKILPRHMSIIYDINMYFLHKVEKLFPNNREILRDVSIIEESSPQQVRMGYLAVVGSHRVNGVAKIHSEIIKKTIFANFVKIYGPDKFINVTNGVTPRRWVRECNPEMSALITEVIGDESWVRDFSKVAAIESQVQNPNFRSRWWDVKQTKKNQLAKYIKDVTGIIVNPNALFDIQVKRIHEYKRQLMNVFAIIYRYITLKRMSKAEREKQTHKVYVFGGKAASAYFIAKLVIKLVNSIADVINNDPEIGDMLKVVFIPDYCVSAAEVIIPASDISQHISTAGTEASGTSNMKFVMNGGLILGTVDGANIEIAHEVGDDQIFMFGVLANEVEDFRHHLTYRSVPIDPSLQLVFDELTKGTFGDPNIFNPLIECAHGPGDNYLLSVDFPSYLVALDAVDKAYGDRDSWITKSILCAARMGKFSSDRSINDYAENIWNIEPTAVAD
ncbi:hypothetical protein BB560_006897 [Smittium megazygosporum]|uniref:Alpha-1,4 glucan phosphorylase n=1 Tax=Smittium megazygosporum TaxID=133381 RepID=A0A2T9Y0F2_9FUNG|nr:hypothetical protein BB560_006897 [Smittium megazygosporum]